jgi:hypothetical protein
MTFAATRASRSQPACPFYCGRADEIAHAISLLKPFPAELVDGYDASKLVNNPQNDSRECIAPIEG